MTEVRATIHAGRMTGPILMLVLVWSNSLTLPVSRAEDASKPQSGSAGPATSQATKISEILDPAALERLKRQADEATRRAERIFQQMRSPDGNDPFHDLSHGLGDPIGQNVPYERPPVEERNDWGYALTIGVKLCLLIFFIHMAVKSWRRQRAARAAKPGGSGASQDRRHISSSTSR